MENKEVENEQLLVPEKQENKQRSKAGKVVSNILFYTVLIAILLAVTLFRGAIRPVFGYSCFTILTTSMQSEIPQGSFIIVKSTDPAEIEVGNDITFMVSDKTSVTHRVIEVIDSYDDSGERVFRTQGVDNSKPDDGVVHAGNVVGVVKISIPELGNIFTYISENIWMCIVAAVLLIVISISVKRYFSKPDEIADENERSKEDEKRTGEA